MVLPGSVNKGRNYDVTFWQFDWSRDTKVRERRGLMYRKISKHVASSLCQSPEDQDLLLPAARLKMLRYLSRHPDCALPDRVISSRRVSLVQVAVTAGRHVQDASTHVRVTGHCDDSQRWLSFMIHDPTQVPP